MNRWSRSLAGGVAALGVALVVVVAPPAAAEAVPASAFASLAPSRILDTRTGLGGHFGRPAVGATLDVKVTGGAVPADATAVVLNVVATDAARSAYVQVLPTAQGTLGASSNLNVGPGATVANLVTVPVGSGGRVTLYDVAGAHLIADVQGYFRPVTTSSAGRFRALTPTRLVDSRDRTGMARVVEWPVTRPVPTPTGPAPFNPGNAKNCGDFTTWESANEWFWTYYPWYGDVAGLDSDDDRRPCEGLGAPPVAQRVFVQPAQPVPGEAIPVTVLGKGGVPASGVSSVVLTVTATQSRQAGFVQVVPTGGATPLGSTSNLNLTAAGETVANLVTVPVGAGGTVQVYTSSGTDVIVDVVGWFTSTAATAGADGLFVPVVPGRLMDTRTTGSPLGAGSQTLLRPLGKAGVPSTGVGAVFVNPVATETASAGYLQLFPTGRGTAGSSSSLNFTGAGQTVANAAIGSIGDGGSVTIYTPTRAHAVVDVLGYFTG